MQILEKAIEDKVVKYAKKLGCFVRKMNGLGARSWPDRLFITPKGYHFYIEFKAEGKRIEKGSAQELFVESLRSAGVVVYECNDAEKGKAIIDAECSR